MTTRICHLMDVIIHASDVVMDRLHSGCTLDYTRVVIFKEVERADRWSCPLSGFMWKMFTAHMINYSITKLG